MPNLVQVDTEDLGIFGPIPLGRSMVLFESSSEILSDSQNSTAIEFLRLKKENESRNREK